MQYDKNTTLLVQLVLNFYVLEKFASLCSLKVLVAVVTFLMPHDLLGIGRNLSHEHATARAAAKRENEADLGDKEHFESFAIFKPAVTISVIWIIAHVANNARGAEVANSR